MKFKNFDNYFNKISLKRYHEKLKTYTEMI